MSKDIEDINVLWALARTSALLTKDRGRQGGLKGTNFIISCLAAYENDPDSDGCNFSINQSKIANASGITPQSVGTLLSSLEDKGLIERVPSESDRRAMNVTLTDAGRKEAAKIHEEQVRFSEQALSCLTENEKKQLFKLLRKLSDSLSEKM